MDRDLKCWAVSVSYEQTSGSLIADFFARYVVYLVLGVLTLKRDRKTQARGWYKEVCADGLSVVQAPKTETMSMYTVSSASRPETLQRRVSGNVARGPPSYRSGSLGSQESVVWKE